MKIDLQEEGDCTDEDMTKKVAIQLEQGQTERIRQTEMCDNDI